ncbi:MAG: CDP-alcohol phosphatidyltransferase family protein [Clostridia bacterium]|nr:CDP-alcohol phosphatidyltransferase family protein [Clostridia bacterium]
MKVKESIKELRTVCQKEDKDEFLISKYGYRYWSIYFTKIFLVIGLSSNTVTFLSLLAALASCYFLIYNTATALFLSAAFISFYFVLDHCDGEVARYYIRSGIKKPSMSGKYFDFLVHYFSSNLMFFFMGMGLYNLYGNSLILISGLISCIGMSNFPNLCIAFSVIESGVYKENVKAEVLEKRIFEDFEKRHNMEDVISSKSVKVKIFALIRELITFPGCLVVLSAVCILDMLTLKVFSFRLVYLLSFTVFSVINTTRKSIYWVNKLK